jgi:hypothetical protein
MSVKAASYLTMRGFNKEIDKFFGGVAGAKRSFRGPEPTFNTPLGKIPVAIAPELKIILA